MKLMRIIRGGKGAIVRDRAGRDYLVHQVKVVLRKMRHYFVRLLTGVLPDGCRIQIVLERVRSVLEQLKDLVGAIVPPAFGIRIRFQDKFELTLVWRR